MTDKPQHSESTRSSEGHWLSVQTAHQLEVLVSTYAGHVSATLSIPLEDLQWFIDNLKICRNKLVQRKAHEN